MKIEMITKEAEMAVSISKKAVRFDSSYKGEIKSEWYPKLWQYLGKHGVKPAGVPYCKYTNPSEDFMQFDIEMGVPVSAPLPEQDELYMTHTCQGKGIVTMHQGAYKDLEHTYAAMMKYLAEHQLSPNGVYYEYYLNDPTNTPERELLTKVICMIK